MNANIRTPAEVIGLVLEEEGVPDFARVAELAARRLAVALASVSTPGAEVVARAPGRKQLEWGTVHWNDPEAPR